MWQILIAAVALVALHSCAAYKCKLVGKYSLKRSKILSKASNGDDDYDDLMNESKFQTFDMESKTQPDGYLNQDIKSMAGEQKSRVLAYIGLALVPCLFLVPFFLSRDFTPPTID